jgi:hypothetical protein
MAEEWKTTIQRWFQKHNQLVARGGMAGDWSEVFADEALMNGEARRWERWLAQRHDRKAQPVKSQTRVIPESVEISDEGVRFRFGLAQHWVYRLKEDIHQEKRLETRTVRLQERNGRWRVIADDQGKEGMGVAQEELPLWQEGGASEAPEDAGRRAWPAQGPVSFPLMNQRMFRQPFSNQSRAGTYQRIQAARYADAWWDGANPAFRAFSVDCTNYISQCLHAGGAPMTGQGRRDQGWWYRQAGGNQDQWSYSWSVAHSLRWYLPSANAGLRAVEKGNASELEIGDVICYDFDGDGRWQHNTIVTAKDSSGAPLVNAHTSNSYHRFWDYRDSYAYTDAVKYKFFHIIDTF